MSLADNPADDPGPPVPAVTVVTPAYREAENLPLMYQRLVAVFEALEISWEWIVVDDHSPDDTFDVVAVLASRDERVRGVRLARNCGSHTALACGLHWSRGDAVVAMAGDLQDPPETIPELLRKWREGNQVVWAVRGRREGESPLTLTASAAYYWLMRNVVGIKDIPSTGADFMLMDRSVVDAFNEFKESTVSVLALITWLGFDQTQIVYDKAARVHGRSGWTLRKKLRLAVDSVTSFSYAPIRLFSYAGIGLALAGFAYAGLVLVNALTGDPVPGWTSLMIVLLVLGGMQMMMTGVIGVYVWRTLNEARNRPRFVVERSTFNATTAR